VAWTISSVNVLVKERLVSLTLFATAETQPPATVGVEQQPSADRPIPNLTGGGRVFRDTLGMRLRGAYLTFHRMANAHFEPLGVTADQFVVLTLLAEEEGLTQREIVARAYSDPNTVGEMLTRLEGKKLVRRERHPTDGRARIVLLTPKGRALQKRLWSGWEGPLREIDAAFKAKELEAIKRLLASVPDAVAESAEAAGGAVA
jgi:DNA-binding MarR family transcriptional regulator